MRLLTLSGQSLRRKSTREVPQEASLRPRRSVRKLCVEGLESRTLLAVTLTWSGPGSALSLTEGSPAPTAGDHHPEPTPGVSLLKIDLGAGYVFAAGSTTSATGLTYQNAGSPTTSEYATIDISSAGNVSSLVATLPGDYLTLGQIRDTNGGVDSITATRRHHRGYGDQHHQRQRQREPRGDRQPHGRRRRQHPDRHRDDLSGRGRQRQRHGQRRRGHALDRRGGHGRLDQLHGQRHHAPRGGRQHRHQRQPGRGGCATLAEHHAHRHPHRAESIPSPWPSTPAATSTWPTRASNTVSKFAPGGTTPTATLTGLN